MHSPTPKEIPSEERRENKHVVEWGQLSLEQTERVSAAREIKKYTIHTVDQQVGKQVEDGGKRGVDVDVL
jgi:hypothetical protein